MKLPIRSLFFLTSVGCIFFGSAIAFFKLNSWGERQARSHVTEALEVRSALAANLLQSKWQQSTALKTLVDEVAGDAKLRVQVRSQAGEILADSAPTQAALVLANGAAALPEPVEVHGQLVTTRALHSPSQGQIWLDTALSLDSVADARRALSNTLLIAMILAMALAVLLSTVAAKVLGRAAQTITGVARNMARGDLSVRTHLAADDDFGELGRTLDELGLNWSTTMQEMRDQRDRLEAILEGMQEGVLLLDEAGRAFVVNPALREMLLLPLESHGKTVLELVRHAELKELLDRARFSSEPIVREIEISNLRPRRLQVRASQSLGAQGALLVVFVDVTEMRRLEAMRRDFVANVSHELRTPIASVRSAAETLELAITRDPQMAGEFLEIITRNALRLESLVEDLLELSRIEARGFKFHIEPLELKSVYSHAIGLFQDKAQRRQVKLVEAVPKNMPKLMADRRAIEHIVNNLVDNAVKYSGAGAEVRLLAETKGAYLRLIVEDTGPGIDARHLPRIFERFYRVDPGRSRDLGGTGLGLSIVKHLVEAMGGNVDVESRLGLGTKFYITLKSTELESIQAVA